MGITVYYSIYVYRGIVYRGIVYRGIVYRGIVYRDNYQVLICLRVYLSSWFVLFVVCCLGLFLFVTRYYFYR
jgi:hypothetical protein